MHQNPAKPTATTPARPRPKPRQPPTRHRRPKRPQRQDQSQSQHRTLTTLPRQEPDPQTVAKDHPATPHRPSPPGPRVLPRPCFSPTTPQPPKQALHRAHPPNDPIADRRTHQPHPRSLRLTYRRPRNPQGCRVRRLPLLQSMGRTLFPRHPCPRPERSVPDQPNRHLRLLRCCLDSCSAGDLRTPQPQAYSCCRGEKNCRAFLSEQATNR